MFIKGKLKRRGSLLLSLGLILVLVAAACADDEDETPTATATSPAAEPTATTPAGAEPTATTPAGAEPTATSPAPEPTATSPAGDIGGSIDVIGTWGGTELESFQAVFEPFGQRTGIDLNFTTTRDLDAILTARVEGGNPPDIAILPSPATMGVFARAGNLVDIAPFLDTDALSQNYAQAWIDLGTVDGTLHGLFFRASGKSNIWYNPKAFAANGYEVPQTWDELIALTNQIRSDGKTPWSIGGDIGWPLTDWVENLMLRVSGPDVYDQWISHDIEWTDFRVRNAFSRFEQIVGNDANLLGGNAGSVATTFVDAVFPLYFDPPAAFLYYEGDFMQGIIQDQFPNLVPGEDFAFFPFPPIDPAFGAPVMGGGDIVVAFTDTPQVRALIDYLSTAEAGSIWAALGGFTSPHKGISLDLFPDALSRESARILTSAEIFRFDASDLMPPEVGNDAFWNQALNFLGNPSSIDQVLEAIEAVADQVS